MISELKRGLRQNPVCLTRPEVIEFHDVGDGLFMEIYGMPIAGNERQEGEC
jgi:hypothetical protein